MFISKVTNGLTIKKENNAYSLTYNHKLKSLFKLIEDNYFKN